MISKNLAQGIVATAPSPATSGTSVVLRSGEGAHFDTPPFLATAAPPDQLSNPDYAEIVLVTAKSTDTLTIVRAKRGTSAKSIAAGWIIANGIYTENVYGFNVTVSTAAATAAKVGTTTAGDYTPTLGDIVNVTFSNGNTVATPTLNIDGSGAKNIRLGNANVTTAFFNTGSSITLRLWYDGTYYQLFGSLLNDNTTYTEIAQAEIINTASTTTRLISGRRAEDLMANEATKARTLTNKTLTSPTITTPTGIVKGDVGLGNVDNTSDATKNSAAATLTNKTLTSPVINTGVSGTAIDTDGTLAANSDTKLASQKATKTYIDSKSSASWVFNETPSGTINGTNTVFTLAQAGSNFIVTKNGVVMKPTDDYTVSGGNTITFVSAPLTGSNILATYTTSSSQMINGSNSLISDETPTGTINGTNKVFTTNSAYIAGSLKVFINGLKQKTGTHFAETTPTSGTFTMDDAPITGDIITVEYQTVASVSGNADTVDGYHYYDLMPIGAGCDFWGTTLPSANWMWAYGQAISRTTYAALFAIIGTTYGSGDGSTTFNLPDKRGRTTAGKDDMGGTSANRLTNQSGGLNGDNLGATGGSETHTLTTTEMPSHTHKTIAAAAGFDGNIVTGGAWQGAASLSQGGTAFRVASNPDTGSAGSGGAHNNVQPTIIANYMIKVA